MKSKFIIIFSIFFGITLQGIKSEKLSYYFDSDVTFDSKIPSPEEFLGYEIGSQITEHSQVVAYYQKIAALSDRTKLVEIGRTHENRKLLVLIVSSPENLLNLEQIKEKRQSVRKGEKPNTPVIVFLGNAVHGNESSSVDAALLSAYYFAAGKSDKITKQLQNGIYFIDPVRNPDGLQRFASWVNANTSVNYYNISSLDREHTESWPRGRGNHYWFDLNRDWINIVHPESKARVAFYQDWLPHVQADHHEMGVNSTFFFEPTDPDGTESRFVPKTTYDLNRVFGKYFSKALDKIGSYYYTEESFDNKNPTFGSTYPDYNGGLGILFEQASSRGLKQESVNGIVEYSFTIRNQLVTTIATVDAANENKDALFDLQKEFFTTNRAKVKNYIFGDSHDTSRLNKFVQLLLDHKLDVYENKSDISINNVKFEKGKSYIIPGDQPNSALVGIIFDDKKDYTEQEAPKLGGYGAGFSVVYSTGLNYDVWNGARGNKVETVLKSNLPDLTPSEIAYVIDFRDSKSQELAFRLLEKDVRLKYSTQPFSLKINEKVEEFSLGSLLIPVKNQSINSNELFKLLKEISQKNSIHIHAVTSGISEKGADLGSSTFRNIEVPKVLVVVGNGISSTESGEVWHHFDQKLKYPIVRIDVSNFSRVDLNDFNNIVFVSGDYSFISRQEMDDLKSWVRSGGTLITLNSASQWAIQNKLAESRTNETEKPNLQQAPGRRNDGRVPTSVFQTKIDLEQILAAGLTSENLPVSRENASTIDPADVAVVISKYTENPLLNGYISAPQLEKLKNSVSIGLNPYGRGSIVYFAENPVFRGTWDATSRTFVNAVLFKNRIIPFY